LFNSVNSSPRRIASDAPREISWFFFHTFFLFPGPSCQPGSYEEKEKSKEERENRGIKVGVNIELAKGLPASGGRASIYPPPVD
jgi:hypothetical protein